MRRAALGGYGLRFLARASSTDPAPDASAAGARSQAQVGSSGQHAMLVDCVPPLPGTAPNYVARLSKRRHRSGTPERSRGGRLGHLCAGARMGSCSVIHAVARPRGEVAQRPAHEPRRPCRRAWPLLAAFGQTLKIEGDTSVLRR